MTFQEAAKSGKKVRLVGSTEGFGLIVESSTLGKIVLTTDKEQRLIVLSDILGEWEADEPPRVFYIGTVRTMNLGTGKETNVLAVREQDTAPEAFTADGKPWIRVLEVK